MKKIVLLSAAAMLVSGNIHALDKGGVFVEPMITYERSEGDINFPTPANNSETEINGIGAGVRLGFHVIESVFLAVDGRYSIPTFEDTALNQDTDSKAWNYGAVLGMQMPTSLAVRAWGGYIIDAVMDPDQDQGLDAKYEDGSGWRVGAGIKLGVSSLNLEYQDVTYETAAISGTGPFAGGTTFGDVELDNQSWIFSVSFPMSL